mmetsp:Transcript_30125/g.71087  ORF Transcript_30125/g.71087 Transcript_30125/m.71087 type:complete len:232 (+) Transcript_30125:369-1064(+)
MRVRRPTGFKCSLAARNRSANPGTGFCRPFFKALKSPLRWPWPWPWPPSPSRTSRRLPGASVSSSTTSEVSSWRRRQRSEWRSCTMMSPSSCFSVRSWGRTDGIFEAARSGTLSGSRARTPTRMTHSSRTSSSEKPTIRSLCMRSSSPASQSSGQGTSGLEQSKAASVPRTSTSTSGRSDRRHASRVMSKSQSACPCEDCIALSKRGRTALCAAVCRTIFSRSGSLLCMAR